MVSIAFTNQPVFFFWNDLLLVAHPLKCNWTKRVELHSKAKHHQNMVALKLYFTSLINCIEFEWKQFSGCGLVQFRITLFTEAPPVISILNEGLTKKPDNLTFGSSREFKSNALPSIKLDYGAIIVILGFPNYKYFHLCSGNVFRKWNGLIVGFCYYLAVVLCSELRYWRL